MELFILVTHFLRAKIHNFLETSKLFKKKYNRRYCQDGTKWGKGEMGITRKNSGVLHAKIGVNL